MTQSEEIVLSAKLLKADEYESFVRGLKRQATIEETVKAAKSEAFAEANEIVSQAENAAKQILEERKSALNDDIDAWVSVERSRRMTDSIDRLNQAVHELGRNLDETSITLSALVVEAVEKIIGSLPDDDFHERLLRTALKDLPHSQSLTLDVSVDQSVQAARAIETLRSYDGCDYSVNVNPNLNSGEMRFVLPNGCVDFGVRAQLDEISKLLVRSLKDFRSEEGAQ